MSDRVGVLGIPFDANSSFLQGPAKAPDRIRAALGSSAGNAYTETGQRVWPCDRVIDRGDLDISNTPADRKPIDEIFQGVNKALDATPKLVCLGGDHAVTYPIVQAMAARHGKVSILHFDAHPDIYPQFDGNRYSHACPMARIVEEGLVDRLVQVGIRSYAPEQAEMVRRYGVEQFAAGNLPSAKDLEFSGPLYVSVDLDGLDPAFAPGVSHPEPGGLTVRELLSTLFAVRTPLLVGADVVELNPDLDPTQITSKVAAKIVKELLGALLRS